MSDCPEVAPVGFVSKGDQSERGQGVRFPYKALAEISARSKLSG